MAKVSVAVKGSGYLVSVEFPAVSGAGFGFEATSASAPLGLGKSVDQAWIKSRAKAFEALITKAMSIDIGQIENYRKTLLKQEVMAKTVRDQVRKAKLDEKAARALAEKLVTDDFAVRWEKFCKVTMPSGMQSCFKLLIKDEAAALKAQLAKEAEFKKGDYSLRPALTIAVSALATVGAILGAATLPAAALAALSGLVGQGKLWVAHRKEISTKLALSRDAAMALRSGLVASVKGLEQSTKALETIAINLKLALSAGALTEMEALAGQGAHLSALEAPQAAKARAALEAAAKARATVAQDLKSQARELIEMRDAIAAAQASVGQALKLAGQGGKVWEGRMKQVEAMLDYVDDALKGVEGIKSLVGA